MASLDDVIAVQQQATQYLGLIYKVLQSGQVNWQPVPATASSTGTAGMIAYESGFLYICVATNTWQRVAIATF